MKKRLIRVAKENVEVSNVDFLRDIDWISFDTNSSRDYANKYFKTPEGKQDLKEKLMKVGEDRFHKSDKNFKDLLERTYWYTHKDAPDSDYTDANLLKELKEAIDFAVDNDNYGIK